MLHLSNLELKVPEETKEDLEKEKAANKEAAAKTDEKKDKTVVADEPKKEVKTVTKAKQAEAKKPAAESPKVAKTAPEAAENKVVNKVAEKESAEKPAASSSTSSEDFGVWLKSIRMGKYLKLFVANEIDVDVLPDLSDADLEKLEIPASSRKRLLKAIAKTDNLHAEVARVVEAKKQNK